MSEVLARVLIQTAITFEKKGNRAGFLNTFADKGLHFGAVLTRGFS